LTPQELEKLKNMNNPLVKTIEDDRKSQGSNKSHSTHAKSIADSKLSCQVRNLKFELEKEKTAKTSAINILKSLKIKDHLVEEAIKTLSN